MDTNMEFADMKAAWQALDRRLEKQHALNSKLFQVSHLEKARNGLRPLFRGQLAQIFLGALMILLGASVYSEHAQVRHLLVAGLIVHVYGVALIMLAGITLGMISRIDSSEAVLVIQKRLARLRTFYIRNGIIAGLSWWLFWIPFVMTLCMGMFGVDVYADVPHVMTIWVPVGVVGLFSTWGFYRWAHRSGRARLAIAMDSSMAGGSLMRAQALLDEIERFESE